MDDDHTFYVSDRIARVFNAIRPVVNNMSEEGYNWAEVSTALSLMSAAINARVDDGLDHDGDVDVDDLLDGLFDPEEE